MSILNSNKWCDFGCHQNSCTLVVNAHTHVVFHTVNEIIYLFFYLHSNIVIKFVTNLHLQLVLSDLRIFNYKMLLMIKKQSQL
jgi:hypothetical protein